ncbi:MAG: hypothetical protein AB7G24_07685 [Novosphingobium sp.]
MRAVDGWGEVEASDALPIGPPTFFRREDDHVPVFVLDRSRERHRNQLRTP